MIDVIPDNVQVILSTYPLLIIDVYADWCMPCKLFAPHFNAVSNELGDKYQFAKLDAGTHRTTTKDFNITDYPLFSFYGMGRKWRVGPAV